MTPERISDIQSLIDADPSGDCPMCEGETTVFLGKSDEPDDGHGKCEDCDGTGNATLSIALDLKTAAADLLAENAALRSAMPDEAERALLDRYVREFRAYQTRTSAKAIVPFVERVLSTSEI